MKKIFLTLSLLVGIANFQLGGVAAQGFMFEFATSGGVIIPNGSEVTVTKYVQDEDPGTGEPYYIMESGLYAKRVDADADQLVRIAYQIKNMDNGNMEICYPSACKSINKVGEGTTQPGVQEEELATIATEWFPTANGTCTVQLNIEAVVKTTNGYTVIDEGPAVTVKFDYTEPTKVKSAKGISVATPVAYYGIDGKRLTAPVHGLVLVRMSDGRVLKRIVD